MVSAVSDSRPAPRANENDRTLTFFGILAGHLGSFGVLYFWLTGAILLFTGNGGQLVEIVRFNGTEHLLYLGYPVVVLLSLFSWVFWFIRRDLVAVGLAGLPVVCAIGFYFYLNTVR